MNLLLWPHLYWSLPPLAFLITRPSLCASFSVVVSITYAPGALMFLSTRHLFSLATHFTSVSCQPALAPRSLGETRSVAVDL